MENDKHSDVRTDSVNNSHRLGNLVHKSTFI